MIHYCGNCAREGDNKMSEACVRCMMEPFREWVAADTNVGNNQQAKADSGKLELDLVPMQIVKDIAQVRMYGNAKYGDPDNWKTVEMRRYVNAMLRHLLAFLADHNSVDEESGIPHYKHMACNLAFISEMMEGAAP